MPVRTLVVDSNALIRGSLLDRWQSENTIYTVREVVAEVKDAATRRRLQVLPFELVFKDPSHQAIQHVSSFARKSGDYQSLSAVDLKLIALTYQLETECGPEKGTQLRAEPHKSCLDLTEKWDLPGIVGFYANPTGKTPSLSGAAERKASEQRDCLKDGESCEEEQDSEEDGEDEEEEEESVIGEDEGWITPDNLKQVCGEVGVALGEEPQQEVTVACVTADYAMQNVMLQMGLHILSVDGKRINRLCTYSLKCKACYRITLDSSAAFCPFCGGRTLYRVSVEVDSEGVLHYRPLSQKQFSRRGLRYSLPLPKGGRHVDNPVPTPDQRVTYKQRRKRMDKVDPLDPDYVAGSSPFALRDVTSRGALIQFTKKGRGGGWRRNPNEVKKKGKRR